MTINNNSQSVPFVWESIKKEPLESDAMPMLLSGDSFFSPIPSLPAVPQLSPSSLSVLSLSMPESSASSSFGKKRKIEEEDAEEEEASGLKKNKSSSSYVSEIEKKLNFAELEQVEKINAILLSHKQWLGATTRPSLIKKAIQENEIIYDSGVVIKFKKNERGAPFGNTDDGKAIKITKGDFTIYAIAVEKSKLNEGLAKKVLALFISAIGSNTIWAKIGRENKAAVRLFESHDFTKEGTFKTEKDVKKVGVEIVYRRDSGALIPFPVFESVPSSQIFTLSLSSSSSSSSSLSLSSSPSIETSLLDSTGHKQISNKIKLIDLKKDLKIEEDANESLNNEISQLMTEMDAEIDKDTSKEEAETKEIESPFSLSSSLKLDLVEKHKKLAKLRSQWNESAHKKRILLSKIRDLYAELITPKLSLDDSMSISSSSSSSSSYSSLSSSSRPSSSLSSVLHPLGSIELTPMTSILSSSSSLSKKKIEKKPALKRKKRIDKNFKSLAIQLEKIHILDLFPIKFTDKTKSKTLTLDVLGNFSMKEETLILQYNWQYIVMSSEVDVSEYDFSVLDNKEEHKLIVESEKESKEAIEKGKKSKTRAKGSTQSGKIRKIAKKIVLITLPKLAKAQKKFNLKLSNKKGIEWISPEFYIFGMIIPENKMKWVNTHKTIYSLSNPSILDKIKGTEIEESLSKNTYFTDGKIALKKGMSDVIGAPLVSGRLAEIIRGTPFPGVKGYKMEDGLEDFINLQKVKYAELVKFDASIYFHKDYEFCGLHDPKKNKLINISLSKGKIARDNRPIGNPASLVFLEEERHKSHAARYSISGLWENLVPYSLAADLKTFVLKNEDLTTEKLIAGLSSKYCKPCSHFQPQYAMQLVYVLREHLKAKIETIFDPCAGYFGEGTGFMATPGIKLYVGNDPNLALHENYKKTVDLYRNLTKTQVCMLPYPIEDIKSVTAEFEKFKSSYKVPKDVTIPKEGFDLVFTSPPYFDRETYSTDETQSKIKFNELSDWQENFLHNGLLVTAWANLRDGGYLALNIFDVKNNNGSKEHVICEPMAKFIATLPGAEYVGVLGVQKPAQIKKRKDATFCAPIFVWQKKLSSAKKEEEEKIISSSIERTAPPSRERIIPTPMERTASPSVERIAPPVERISLPSIVRMAPSSMERIFTNPEDSSNKLSLLPFMQENSLAVAINVCEKLYKNEGLIPKFIKNLRGLIDLHWAKLWESPEEVCSEIAKIPGCIDMAKNIQQWKDFHSKEIVKASAPYKVRVFTINGSKLELCKEESLDSPGAIRTIRLLKTANSFGRPHYDLLMK